MGLAGPPPDFGLLFTPETCFGYRKPLSQPVALLSPQYTRSRDNLLDTHIATHGFILAAQNRDPGGGWRPPEAAAWQAGSGTDRLSGQRLENPLLRSGLALAGAAQFAVHASHSAAIRPHRLQMVPPFTR